MDDDWPKTGEFLSTLAKSRRLAIALPHASLLARRAAEVGFHRALIARDQLPGAAAEDCRAVGRLPANAANELDAYIENLSPTSREPHALELPLVSLLGTGPVTFEKGVPLIGGLTVQQCHAKAREDASVLLQAARALACYGGAASAMRERIRKDRRNPGKPDEVAFFLPLAEAWICITGRPPGRSKSTNEGSTRASGLRRRLGLMPSIRRIDWTNRNLSEPWSNCAPGIANSFKCFGHGDRSGSE